MIIILNFGGQFCHLIARRIRELGVHSEILPFDVDISKIASSKPDGIILSGGPSSVYEKEAPRPDSNIFSLGVPILGICYGMHIIASYHGGKIQPSDKTKEYGEAKLEIIKSSKLTKGLNALETVWMSHGDSVISMPENFHVIGKTKSCPYAFVEEPYKQLYGVQFHLEVSHTVCGTQILKNFVEDVCKAKKNWIMKDLKESLVQQIKEQVGDEEVVMGVSGGVDSTVAATILHKAIGSKLHCVFIDHGLLREGERDEVVQYFTEELKLGHFYCVDASKLFLKKLEGVEDPEQKRKIIGHSFIRAFEDQVLKLTKDSKNKITFLGQGTIYPDRIESAEPSKQAAKIKSHHNLTLPEDMKLKVIEPLKEFYKDEVRQLGKELGIPEKILNRHPFPGPGLAIRILGTINEERLRMVREADHIFIQTLREFGWYDKVWQALAALLPVKTVGVMGDTRTYEYIISLRAVNSVDGMTADIIELPYEILKKCSNRIINEVKGVNRVLYDVSQKPPATIEYE